MNIISKSFQKTNCMPQLLMFIEALIVVTKPAWALLRVCFDGF
jgi:hypothetical protein